MDYSSVIELVSVHMDEDVLGLMSETPLWSIISPLLSNQHFWFLKAQTVVNFHLEWDPAEEWHQVYNILSDASRTGEFSPEVLQKNRCNLLAVKILLRLGYDPSIKNGEVLLAASRVGHIEVMRLLLQDKRIKRLKKLIKRIILQAASESDVQIIKLLAKEVGMDSEIASKALLLAVENNSTGTIEVLLRHTKMNINSINPHPMKIAILNHYIGMIRLLLSKKRLVISGMILREALNSGNNEIIYLLFTDRRSLKWKNSIRDVLLKSEELGVEGRTIEVLIRLEYVDLGEMPRRVLEYIVKSIYGNISDYIQGCVILSGGLYTENDILEFLTVDQASYNKLHYSMLIRELILKRKTHDYYMKWLLKQSQDRWNNVSVRQLLSSTLSMESIGHPSALFTAYRGFSMLENEDDGRRILHLLSEEGASQEGINMAGALIGAYLGERHI